MDGELIVIRSNPDGQRYMHAETEGEDQLRDNDHA